MYPLLKSIRMLLTEVAKVLSALLTAFKHIKIEQFFRVRIDYGNGSRSVNIDTKILLNVCYRERNFNHSDSRLWGSNAIL